MTTKKVPAKKKTGTKSVIALNAKTSAEWDAERDLEVARAAAWQRGFEEGKLDAAGVHPEGERAAHLNDAMARLAVLAQVLAKAPIADTTVREGLLLAVTDIVEDIDAARQLDVRARAALTPDVHAAPDALLRAAVQADDDLTDLDTDLGTVEQALHAETIVDDTCHVASTVMRLRRRLQDTIAALASAREALKWAAKDGAS